jgi:acetyl-CoA carboxylase alpha subunit
MAASDLKSLGLIDGIVPEPPEGAHTDPDKAAEFVKQAIRTALDELSSRTDKELIDDRYKKFRDMGNFFAEGKGA